MTHDCVPLKRRYWCQVVAVFVLALAFRAAYVAVKTRQLPPDTDLYRAIGNNLFEGRGYAFVQGQPTAYRPPAYAVFVGLVEQVLGARSVLFAQCVLGASVAVLSFVLARLLVDDIFALLAGLMVAVDPYEVATCAQFMTETFFALAVVASVWFLVNAVKRPRPAAFAAAGMASAIGILTRPEWMLILPVGIVGALMCSRRGLRVVSVCAFLAMVVLPVGLWAFRNSRATGTWVITTTHGGYTHRLAYNAVFWEKALSAGKLWDGGSESLAQWQARLQDETAGMSEVARDRHHYRMASGFIAAGARRALTIAASQVAAYWRPYPHIATSTQKTVLAVYCVALFALAAVGLAGGIMKHPLAGIVLYVLVAESFIHAYYWSNIRMRVPFHPLLAVAAAVGLQVIRNCWLRSTVPARPADPASPTSMVVNPGQLKC